jgi:hypothetical protein
MAKFVCIKCNNKETNYSFSPIVIKAKGGKTTYHYRNGEEICCMVCHIPLTIIEEPFDGFGTAHLKFNSMTSDQKKAVLKRRANEHFKQNTDSMKDYRDHVEQSSDKV